MLAATCNGSDPSLAKTVRDFACSHISDPSKITREQLAYLGKVADRDFAGAFAAQYAPIAPETWMMRVQMETNVDEAPVQPLTFPAPVELVGIFATVTGNPLQGNPPFVFPTLDQFDASVLIDDHERFTSNTPPQQAPTNITEFVSLPWLLVNNPRLWGLALISAKPKVTFKVRWAIDATVRTTLALTRAQVSIGFAVRFIDRPATNWGRLNAKRAFDPMG